MPNVLQKKPMRALRKEDWFGRTWQNRKPRESGHAWSKRLKYSCDRCLHKKSLHVSIFGCIEEVECGGFSCYCGKFVPMKRK